MAVSIDETGILINEFGPKDNPREVEFFSHQVKHTIPSNNCITNWVLSGDVPIGISINGAGLISGTIAGMWDQPSCIPKKEQLYPELDGRNQDKNGRYAEPTYTFNFSTTVYWTEPDSEGTPCKVSGTTSKNHSIILVKDYDCDTIKFAVSYLDGIYLNNVFKTPFHCTFTKPSTKEQCELLGGTWDFKLNKCSLVSPNTEQKCKELGGEWNIQNNTCNLEILMTKEQCELIGGTWTKNILINKGIKYYNSTDYLNSIGLSEKKSKLGI